MWKNSKKGEAIRVESKKSESTSTQDEKQAMKTLLNMKIKSTLKPLLSLTMSH